MRRFVFMALLASISVVVFASNQTLTLRDGTRVYGTFVSGNSQSVTFQDENGNQRQYNIDEVQSIDMNASQQSGDRYGDRERNRNYGSGNTQSPFGGSSNRTDNRNRRYSDARTVPAGTEFTVRTNETIDSNSGSEGRFYSAQVDKDVTDSNGQLLVPKGSDAQLVLKRMSQGGTTGSAEMVLDLHSVNINGRRYLVTSNDVRQSTQRGIGKNRRTAEMVGGGAALGTLLGAIAGGGKGAVIGAIAGAAAGGAAEVLTKGKEVRVPAETVLTFRLDQPVRLEAYR